MKALYALVFVAAALVSCAQHTERKMDWDAMLSEAGYATKKVTDR